MKFTLPPLIILFLVTFSANSFSKDYYLQSDKELLDIKKQLHGMDETEKKTYRTELQNPIITGEQTKNDSRFGDMGASGKKNLQRMTQKKRSNGKHKGKGKGKGKRRGSQTNDNNQYRYGQGNDSESELNYRYDQGNDSSSENHYRYGQGSSERFGLGI